MGSYMRLPGIIGAAALVGAAVTVAAPAAQAQVTAGGMGRVRVACSTDALVAAINAANGHGGATLVLPANCTYSLTSPAAAGDGLPLITASIGMLGGPSTVISRSTTAPAFRLLDVAAGGMLRLSNISLQNGSTAGLGGGIQNAGTLQLNRVAFSGNTAGNGGGLANASTGTATVTGTLMDGNTTTGVGGGGIINSGTLTLIGSTLARNTAPINGGGLNTQASGVSRIIHSEFTRNVSGGLGGAISNLGTTSLAGAVVRMNRGSSGGGIATGNSNVTLVASVVTANTPDNCNPVNTIPGCVN